MPKIYRTMQGEQVDIEALFRKNELTVAVGNMQANARGDELGPGGTIVKTREQKAREYYQKQKALKAQAAKEQEEAEARAREEAELEAARAAELAKLGAAKTKPAKLKANTVEPKLDPLEDPDGTEGLT